MATNTLLVPSEVASLAAELLAGDLGVAATVSTDVRADFADRVGSSIRVRVPGAVKAIDRGVGEVSPLTRQNIAEQYITVTLEHDRGSVVPISDADYTLNLKEYGVQVLSPQVSAIANSIERDVVAKLKAAPVDAGIAYDPAKPTDALAAIRTRLRSNGVPASTKLHLAVAPDVYGDLLAAGAFNDNATDGGLSVAKSFTVIESNRLEAGELIGYIRNSIALAVVAPEAPQGAPFSASQAVEGGAVRIVNAWDPSVGVDTSYVNTFVGVAAMPLPVVDEDAGSVTLVTNGGIVHVASA
ncbi:P22 phage major capsid protein family protein [Leifsonia sp. AG29]|uniref:P22 phage major capsid protein family protein n=1 Tax=Leifsonia sp. AG29 TaxID=2598860 RepID=UPI00131CB049|nr:P22 phage major capsid protein family protein [Leifsonia sp. AG29]